MIDPARVIGRVQPLPGVRFVGVNDCAGGDVLADQRDCIALARHNEWKGPPHHFAGDDYDLALAGLFLSKPAISTIRFAVRLLDLTAEIRAVDFYRTRELGLIRVLNLGAHRFPQLVRDNEGRLVLAIEIAAQLQGAMALDAVHKDRDREKVIPNRAFAILKNGARRYRKLIAASAAFPQLTGREGIDLGAAALRAVRLALGIGPTDRNELRMRFLIRHARNGAQRERPCGCGKEEVLRHRQI